VNVVKLIGQDRIDWIHRELDECTMLAKNAKQMAYNPVSGEWAEVPKPDLIALPKILELQCRVHGLLTADGKGAPRAVVEDNIAVPIEELKRTLKAVGYSLTEEPSNDSDSREIASAAK
jgi:hypothetical protein